MKKLDRTLGLGSVVAIAIGSMIGGGIFVLPGLAVATTGPSAWMAYFFAGLFVIPAALSQSEMATAMPKAGGVYIFADRSMGPLYGTMAGIGTWLAMLFKASFALVGISVYLNLFTQMSETQTKVVAFVLLVVVAGLNIIGVKKLGKFQIVVVIICALSLGSLVGKGVFTYNPERFTNYFSGGTLGLFMATGLVFISYAGVTKIASIAEEIINPARNLPLAMLLSLGLMMTLYSLVAFTLVGNIPLSASTKAASLAGNESAIALLGGVLFGKFGQFTMAVIAIVALASMANAGLLSASRYPFAMSRDSMVPRAFSQVNDSFGTPVFSILFTTTCMGLAIGFLPVTKIAKLASGMQVLLFMAVNISVIIFRESNPEWYKPKFRSPLYPGVQIFGILSCLLLLFTLGSFVFYGTIVAMIAGAGWYYFYASRKTRRRGIIQKMRTRPRANLNFDSEESEDVQPADLVISLSGSEFSPESLLSLGSAIGGNHVSVVRIAEIPDQLALHEQILDETPRMQALRRRLNLKSKQLSLHTNIDFVASHDRRQALYKYVKQSNAAWTIVDMGPHQHFHQMKRYLGWLTSHLPNNLLVYQNEGIQITKKILALYGDAPNDSLVMDLANNLAEIYDAKLKILTVIPEDASDDVQESFQKKLEEVMSQSTVPFLEIEIVRGEKDESFINESVHHDLMVMGYPRGNSKRVFSEIACSVLMIRPTTDVKHFPKPTSLMLLDLLDPRTIRMHDNVENNDELFGHLGQLFSKVTVQSAESIEGALQNPAVMDNATILDSGVTILHASCEGLSRSHLGMIFLDELLDTVTGKTNSDLVVLLLSPPDKHETSELLYQQLGEMMDDQKWVDLLRAAPETTFVMQLLRARYIDLLSE